ncbi:MAG: outer membrane lipoprotein carrier protein LolA [Acidobacteria bacterium]|nr:outer membrane lipoprotein carrier protein LolA [Acidobacteriota bacterium]
MVVERLNKAAEHFQTLTANLQFTKVTVVVDDKSTESGRLFYSKNRRMLIEMTNPEAKEILFTGNKAFIYYPKMAQIQEFDLSKHRALVEQFLLLGFGTKGDELKDSYLITVLGETKLEGQAVLQLELTPKDERIRNQIHKIHLWIDLASWVPIQQKFFEVGGDYLLTRYTEIKVNVPIASPRLQLSAPRGTRRVKPRADM